MSNRSKKVLAANRWADTIFAQEGICLTLGGEPTYVPEHPKGMEWAYSAVGPTKLSYARRMADELLKKKMAGGAVFFSPGKQYPGEINPRWALRIIVRRDGKKIFNAVPSKRRKDESQVTNFLQILATKLGLNNEWIYFSDPQIESKKCWALPLDHDGVKWFSAEWKLEPAARVLIDVEGPAGLRLPLNLLSPQIPRRILTTEFVEGRLYIFFPPLQQPAFTELLHILDEAISCAKIGLFELQGYVPEDVQKIWTVLSLAADPGVLEVNLPPCIDWADYDAWIHEVTACAKRVDLRSWKQCPGEYPVGTGGGNHLLLGGASIDENPFLTRPKWLASILRYFQRHPSLAYLFTSCYVGAYSQAPRPDESSKNLFDLEMAYHFLETLPPGDHRIVINETLRHLHADVTGNPHRCEISFDKFWNPSSPNGCLGLIEFRAVESLPTPEWMSAVAMLWRCIAAFVMVRPVKGPLRPFDNELHDRYFLPTILVKDLESLFDELQAAGCSIPRAGFRKIWNWRFPKLLSYRDDGACLEVRRAHEDWPLLCETPMEGDTTSRFVDTSMHRIEVCVNDVFINTRTLYVRNRELPFTPIAPNLHLAGLRYRRSFLYPCLHPGIPIDLPLDFIIADIATAEPLAAYQMDINASFFRRINKKKVLFQRAKPCCSIFKGALTHDLRVK